MTERIIVFSSGQGSGFRNLLTACRDGRVNAQIVGLVTNRKCLAETIAAEFDIKTIRLEPAKRSAADHAEAVSALGDGWCALSGCLWKVAGLDPRRTFNIHPGPLPRFGGTGMYGDGVHKAVVAAGEGSSAVTMHFVTEEYDQGPIFFEKRVPVLYPDWQQLKGAIKDTERYYQPYVTNLVVNGEIYWDGKNPKSLNAPRSYRFLPPLDTGWR